ncbi:hypothetical protein KCP77_14150 [Salmonella enterica subsp. enterica]|nr:hypothetical protein KCP77_14150 [Salmonella enterica subsp. enterica]
MSACGSEPVRQATAAHVSPDESGDVSAGEANCAMIGGSLSSGPTIVRSEAHVRATQQTL